ncbi:MAG: o-succinylbenzoate synthase [Propionibacteriaceae bacterium]|jgi:O-succinylbenzoate synthase|nr:o-succinylbenzoate synthase [Propionibacteriaceae bacterium]
MKLSGFELRRVQMPLVTPFRTSFGIQTHRDIPLIRAVGEDVEGWGECVALVDPVYSSEYADGVIDVMTKFFIPALAAGIPDAVSVSHTLSPFKGHRMAKAALEMAVLDAELRLAARSFARELGSIHDKVPCGVSVGIMDSIPQLLDFVARYIDEGYRRIKIKIEPGWDISPVAAIRERWPSIPLQVDANTAYTLADARHLAKLDDFDLLLIEQPLDEEDVLGHAELARQLHTPICLDESIVSAASAAAAIKLGATSVINIKPGRVGGYLEARRIHDVAQANGIPVWCGGMVESGLARAANIALASLPGFTLPGDVSASSRFYVQDITGPWVMEDGYLTVPTGPGLGVEPIPEILEDLTTWKRWVPLG